MTKQHGILLAFLFLLLIYPTVSAGARAMESGPTLLNRTVAISTKRFLRYWPNPRAAEPQYNTWSWTPKVYFEMLGPVPGGGQLVFEVNPPDGNPGGLSESSRLQQRHERQQRVADIFPRGEPG